MDETIRRYANTLTAPGERHQYSNLGYGILGRLITNLTGVEYREVVRERILEPLGMSSSGYLAGEVPRERLARGYLWQDGAHVEQPVDGYGALAPWLDPALRRKLDAMAGWAFLALLGLMIAVPGFSQAFWAFVGLLSSAVGIPLQLAAVGYDQFRFW